MRPRSSLVAEGGLLRQGTRCVMNIDIHLDLELVRPGSHLITPVSSDEAQSTRH